MASRLIFGKLAEQFNMGGKQSFEEMVLRQLDIHV